MEIKTLKGIAFGTIHKAFTKAFEDYEMSYMPEEVLKQMLTRRGMNQDLSVGAFVDDEIVSFTFNGIGEWNGKITAYDTGTGTVKEYRKQGLARKIFEAAVPVLKEAGIEQYLLEVLQHNEKAIPLYQSVGFKITREFDYFVSPIKDLKFNNDLKANIIIKEIDIPDESMVKVFCNYEHSWQNHYHSMNRTPHKFKTLGAFKENQFVGYLISELESGDITQLAVHKNFRRQGIATALLKKILNHIPGDSIKLINTESSDSTINNFLLSVGVKILGKQFEMIKQL